MNHSSIFVFYLDRFPVKNQLFFQKKALKSGTIKSAPTSRS